MGEVGEAFQMGREAIDRMTEGWRRYQSVVQARQRARDADERLATLTDGEPSEEDLVAARLASKEARKAVEEALAAL